MKRSFLTAAFALLLVFPAGIPAALPFYSAVRIRANAIYFKAMDLRKEEKYAAALRGIKKAIAVDPASGIYYLQAARLCLHKLKRYTEAVTYYRRAARLMPDNPWAVTELACALERAKRYTQSIRVYRRAIAWFKSAHRPPLYRLYTGLGRALRDFLKQPRQALAVYREGHGFFPNRAHLLLESAKCRAAIRDRKGCLRDCRNTVALAVKQYFRVPYDIDWKIARLLRTRLKAPRETLRHLRTARQRHPAEPFLKIQTAYAFSNLKQYRQAVRWYEAGLYQYRRLKLPHNYWYYNFLAEILRRNLKKPGRALAWLKKADHLQPANVHITVRIGHAYGDLKQYRKQIKAYLQYISLEEAQKKKPGIWVSHWIADILRRDLKRPKESIRFIRQSIRKHPDDPYLQERLGYAFGDLKQYGKQVAAYREYIRLSEKTGKKPSAWRFCNTGDILRNRLKDPRASLRILKKGVRLYPDYSGLPLRMGNAYGALKEYRNQYNAYRRYIRLMEKKKKRPSAWIILSCSNILRKELKAPSLALVLLKSMRRHHPKDWRFPLHRAFALGALKHWREEAASYREAIRLKEKSGGKVPGWVRSWCRKAEKRAGY